MGFTDVYFCPLLANDLAAIFLKMLQRNLSGLYHVVSRECLSKYEFGVRLANQFELDTSLISHTSVEQGGLTAARSPRLTLRVDRLAAALGEPLPEALGLPDPESLREEPGAPQEDEKAVIPEFQVPRDPEAGERQAVQSSTAEPW